MAQPLTHAMLSPIIGMRSSPSPHRALGNVNGNLSFGLVHIVIFPSRSTDSSVCELAASDSLAFRALRHAPRSRLNHCGGRGSPQIPETLTTAVAQAAIVALLAWPEVFGIQCLRSVCKPFSQYDRYYR